MKQFILGALLGRMITGGLSMAGTFYDSKGNVKAPSGSQQQFDYFRQRQQFLDIHLPHRAHGILRLAFRGAARESEPTESAFATVPT